MKTIIKYMRPFAGRMTAGLVIKIAGTMMDLLLPYILEYIIDDLVPTKNLRVILIWGAVMVVCSVIGVSGNIIANRMASLVARNTARAIRHDLFAKTLRLTARQSDEFTVPSLEARLTSDTYNVHHFIGMIQRLGVRAPILLIGGICLTFTLDSTLTLVMLATLPLITAVVWLVSSKGIPLYTKQQQSADRMVRTLREDAQGIRVIKALSRIDYEKNRFEEVNRDVVRNEKKASLTMGLSNPIMTFLLNGGLTAVILVGALRVSAGSTEVGMIIAFMSYFTLISNAMLSVTRMFVMYSKGSASAARIAEVINTPTDLPVLESRERDVKGAPAVEFDRVGFSYNKVRNNLTDVSFSLRKGGTLGIIGATGSGKTTLALLLMRFYDPDSGVIRINGTDIRSIPESELHSLFGVAFQNDFIFSGTVEENARFDRDIELSELAAAAKTAQADGYIEQFEEKWAHTLNTNGTNISGGQRQRLFITRAVAGSPEILILDDSSSALDYKTDSLLRRELNGLHDLTKIIIAQRVSSVMYADLILVLDGGKVIGSGTHEELLRTCPVYEEISASQMGGAVLE